MQLIVDRWFNGTPAADGRVALVYAFQMRCYGCVQHAIPQAKRVHAANVVQVIGLHSVFEDHASMDADALQAFIVEQDLRFPIGIDSPAPNESIPRTMRLYDMLGTPTLLAFNRAGRLRRQHFGHMDDERLEGLVNALLAED